MNIYQIWAFFFYPLSILHTDLFMCPLSRKPFTNKQTLKTNNAKSLGKIHFHKKKGIKK